VGQVEDDYHRRGKGGPFVSWPRRIFKASNHPTGERRAGFGASVIIHYDAWLTFDLREPASGQRLSDGWQDSKSGLVPKRLRANMTWGISSCNTYAVYLYSLFPHSRLG